MRLYEGNILTCDKENRIAHYLLEDQGKILYCGDELPAGCVAAERVSTGEGALIPPFVDSHIHFASYATFHAGLNVMNARSNEEILQMLREHVKKTKEKLVIGFGASPYSVSDGHLVRRVQLDEVCPDKPLFLVKYDGHACVVNTVLLNEVRGKVQHLRGFHEDTGEMNQEAFFAVSDYITASLSTVQLVAHMQKALDDLAARGIGMIHTVSGVGFARDLDVDLERFFARGITNGMPVVFEATLRPTPSIALPQESVDLRTGEEVELKIKGRHDPCIVHRARSVVDSITALTVGDLLTLKYGTEWAKCI